MTIAHIRQSDVSVCEVLNSLSYDDDVLVCWIYRSIIEYVCLLSKCKCLFDE